MSQLCSPEQIIARVPEWAGKECSYEILHGGLANRSYIARVDGKRYVIKSLTQAMDDFGLMIPMEDIFRNTAAAGVSGVGARVLHSFPDLPALVLEFIDGRTLSTAELSVPDVIPQLGEAIACLHHKSATFSNSIDIWSFLADYLKLVEKHDLATPQGLLPSLDKIREIEVALRVNALSPVPSHNDLLPLNIMDDGRIRLIDYDFSGMNDPCFDLGDLAMEGDYTRDQMAILCTSYFGEDDPVQAARVELFGIAAQFTWSILFVAMGALLPEMPDETFDYWSEATSRWGWTRRRLDSSDIDTVIKIATS